MMSYNYTSFRPRHYISSLPKKTPPKAYSYNIDPPVPHSQVYFKGEDPHKNPFHVSTKITNQKQINDQPEQPTKKPRNITRHRPKLSEKRNLPIEPTSIYQEIDIEEIKKEIFSKIKNSKKAQNN